MTVDMFGREIKLGTKVLYSNYDKDSQIRIGVVVKETPKQFQIEPEDVAHRWYRKRTVHKDYIGGDVIVLTDDYRDIGKDR